MKAKTDYTWKEYACTEKYWFVCEMPSRGGGNHNPPEGNEYDDHP